MRSVALGDETDFAGWRQNARTLALRNVPPDQVVWLVGDATDLFADAQTEDPLPDRSFNVPRVLVELAEIVIQAREPERFALLYSLVWRIYQGEKHLLRDLADSQVQRAQHLKQAVHRDTHKMRAFLRFREVRDTGGLGADAASLIEDGRLDAVRGEPRHADRDTAQGALPEFRYVAWFEPDHFIVDANAPFFVRRFSTMQWSILTPDRCAHWNGRELWFSPGADKSQLPDDDALAEYWRIYFSAIFNPARLKTGAMMSEMPRKYWKNMPETTAIPGLIREAQARTDRMLEQPVVSPSAEPPQPKAATGRIATAPPVEQVTGGLPALAGEAASCRRCPLWEPATQTVFGEGPADARLMLVGEQPGDQEDLSGRPFVGPAGQLLDRALAEAGIDRRAIYLTNAVKHFKFEPRGKRRIHAKPGITEIVACNVWLEQERTIVRPALTVALGATAARAILGRTVTIGRERGRPIRLDGNAQAFVTVHPSYLLRLPDEESRKREYRAFVEDLRHAASLVE